ncbi:chloride channel protein [Heyndrickxia ginsengihumi]|uniref:Chloride channel protein n=1 Tax=Heyndrickxia ginsengihumi TaxID=363870 RepID=A0A6M0P1L5_9BACI|nr:chloride channel protein [Heyndrickxia ginsengihumi]MBE6183305.1 chloride channel protein [Bacillus sp. (in: firmicutes)]MCM3022280.1 chloride channel protein [Heyndrickxia ginsengihumi]NEY18514.1 chloride channel protein [Heyndrickxia ginsengihumi]
MKGIQYVEPLVMLATLIRLFFFAALSGIVVGTGVTLFLKALLFTLQQTGHISLWMQMLLLPIGGLLNGLVLYYGNQRLSNQSDSFIAAVNLHSGIMPLKPLAIKPIAALITLSSGGSSGKFGPCAHIGGTVASLFGQLLHLKPEIQKIMVVCGISAGFSSVFGTPIAGAIFGVEVLTIGRIRHDYIFPAVVASVIAVGISKLASIPYPTYTIISSSSFSEDLFMKMIILGILCGISAWIFIELLQQIKLLFNTVQRSFHLWQPFIPFLGGVLLSILILIIPTDYLGLSIPIMNHALNGDEVPYCSFLWKALFVAITLGSGFYGGTVTPQFVIGALSGNVFAHLLGISPVLGSEVGMVAVVAAASNTPIAAIFMGYELFGSVTGLYAVIACITAYIVIGHRSVYPDQLVIYKKSLWMYLHPGIELGKENIHFSYSLLKRIERMRHHHRDGH